MEVVRGMGEIVEFPSNGQTAQGYLALPDGTGPGVVVIQEWWGLVPHIKNVCDRFAGEGFVALAPDLYHGQATTEPDEANKLLMAMEMDRAARDMSGAVEHLRSREEVKPKKVGVTGFCAGGGLVLKLAATAPVDAAVPFYPFFVPEDADPDAIRAPVLAHLAERDPSTEKSRPFLEDLRSRGKDVEVQVYPGADHAFFNDDRPGIYDEAASKLAWQRTLEFFRRHLS
jgi:carboxymethylenebutenolidase